MKYIKSYDNLTAYNADKENFEYPHVSYIVSGDSIIYDTEAPKVKSLEITHNDNARDVPGGFVMEGFPSGLASYDFTMSVGNNSWDISVTHDDRIGDWTLTFDGDDGMLSDYGSCSFDNEDVKMNFMALCANDSQSFEWPNPANAVYDSETMGDFNLYNLQYTTFDKWTSYVILGDVPYDPNSVTHYTYNVHWNNAGVIEEYDVEFDFNPNTGEIENAITDNGVSVGIYTVDTTNHLFNMKIYDDGEEGWDEGGWISVTPMDNQSEYGYLVQDE